MTNVVAEENLNKHDDNQESESSRPVDNSNSENSVTTNEEVKRRVSIALSAIQVDNERQKRNSCNSLHKLPELSASVNNGCGYVNYGFANTCHPGEKRTSISSYSLQRMKRRSNSVRSGKLDDDDGKEDATSWWYVLCIKCRQKEVGPGWEPEFWPKLCPYPFCPTYRHIARLIALVVIGILIWTIVYCILGKEALPGGQLFNMALLCLVAHLVGCIFRILMLPALLGMIITGIVFQNTHLILITGGYQTLSSILRKICLVVLLTRAGLDLDPHAMKKLYVQVMSLGILPWVSEAVCMGSLTYFILGLPWNWACLLGVIFAAVAPAVVVPCLFRLRNKGYGVSKGIPTLIIAVAGIGDGLSVAFFGLFHSIIFSDNSLVFEIFIGFASLLGGIIFGALWGFVAKVIPEKEDPFVVPLRILMLLCGGLTAVFGSEHCGIEGAGPVGVIAAAFMSVYCWSLQGWSIEDNPVATAFEVFWMLCEPILFSLTGTQVVLNQLEPGTIVYGATFIAICFLTRLLVTIIVATGSSLNLKEKIFSALSWMSKASVQAVLAPAALESARKFKKTGDVENAGIVLTICIMSMLITVPIGAVSITCLGTRLLTKTKQTIPMTGWRRQTRPSLRDISIIDEEIDLKFDEEQGNGKLSDHEVVPNQDNTSLK